MSLLRSLCKSYVKWERIAWDDPVDEEMVKKWDRWEKGLGVVGEILFSRSLVQFVEEKVTRKWLHGSNL